jgi:hypothetical protein
MTSKNSAILAVLEFPFDCVIIFSDRKRAKNTKCGFIVFRCIRIVYDEANNMVILEWKSTPTADAYADSVLAMVIRVDTEAKVTAKVRKNQHEHQIALLIF